MAKGQVLSVLLWDASQWQVQYVPNGAPTPNPYLDHFFYRKLHEIEKNWTEEGSASLPHLDQPIRIHCLVNDYYSSLHLGLVQSSRNLLEDVMGLQQLRIYVGTLCYFEIQGM